MVFILPSLLPLLFSRKSFFSLFILGGGRISEGTPSEIFDPPPGKTTYVVSSA